MAEYIHLNVRRLLGDLNTSKIQIRETKRKTLYYAISLGHKASAKLYSILYAGTALYMERKFQKFLQGVHNNDHQLTPIK